MFKKLLLLCDMQSSFVKKAVLLKPKEDLTSRGIKEQRV
jgi:hypothetical protein